MRFMVIMKYDGAHENQMPDPKYVTMMHEFNAKLLKAGVMKQAEGLHPTSKGARVRFTAKGTKVIDGPFTEAKELLAGWWIWECKDKAEALEWVKQIPMPPLPAEGGPEVELRQVWELNDWAPEYADPATREAALQRDLAKLR